MPQSTSNVVGDLLLRRDDCGRSIGFGLTNRNDLGHEVVWPTGGQHSGGSASRHHGDALFAFLDEVDNFASRLLDAVVGLQAIDFGL